MTVAKHDPNTVAVGQRWIGRSKQERLVVHIDRYRDGTLYNVYYTGRGTVVANCELPEEALRLADGKTIYTCWMGTWMEWAKECINYDEAPDDDPFVVRWHPAGQEFAQEATFKTREAANTWALDLDGTVEQGGRKWKLERRIVEIPV